jgi:hypothetical protein
MNELKVVSPEEEAELGGGADGRKRTQGERLHEAVNAADVTLFHDAENRSYATFERDGHRETWPIQSLDFRHYLNYLYYSA